MELKHAICSNSERWLCATVGGLGRQLSALTVLYVPCSLPYPPFRGGERCFRDPQPQAWKVTARTCRVNIAHIGQSRPDMALAFR